MRFSHLRSFATVALLSFSVPFLLTSVAAPPALAQTVEDRQAEADRLLQQGIQQYRTSQFQAAFRSWEGAIRIYQEINNLKAWEASLEIVQVIGNRQEEFNVLVTLGNLYTDIGEYQQAISFYEQSLALARELEDRQGEADTLSNLGVVYDNFGEYQQAISFYEQSLTLTRELEDREGEADTLNNLGAVYVNLGEYQQAIAFYEQSLAIKRELDDREGEATTLNNLGIVYFWLDQYQQAIAFYEQSLDLIHELDYRRGEAAVLGSLGDVYVQLGEYQRAIAFYEQSLAIGRELGDRQVEAGTLGDLGIVHNELREYQQAIAFYEQSLTLTRELGDRQGEVNALNNLGRAYDALGDYRQAIVFHEQSLALTRELGYRQGEAHSLGNLGNVYVKLGEYQQAITSYEQGLTLTRELGYRSAEAVLLSGFGYLWADQEQPELAIAFLKQSVNRYEEIRGDIRQLEPELQQSYADSVAGTYRRLADLLLAQGDILAAQQVLELLKLEELREFTRGSVQNVAGVRRVEQTDIEQEVLAVHGSLVALGQQIVECEQTRPVCGERDALLDRQEALTNEFIAVRDRLIADIRTRFGADTVALNPDDFIRQAGDLLQDNPHTMLIYPLVLDDKLWVVWGTSGGVVNQIEVLDVDREKLGQAVLRFRQLMQDCELGGCGAADIPAVQAVAQEIYGYLIPPQLEAEFAVLEQQAAAAGEVANLVFSLDRVTRYIPTAALFDGNQYLIERFTVSTVLSAGLTYSDRPLPPGTEASVLALGLSESVPAIPEENIRGFGALDYVPIEINGIVQTETASGIFPGETKLNGEFDDDAFRQLLDRQILHIATHGEFVPIRYDLSYLMLGTKQPLRISEIQRIQRNFQNLSLVVLSACETALGEPDQEGNEINGIAHSFIQAGVNTVVASLWQVNDRSTSVFMQDFYNHLALGTVGDRVTVAEAMRESQLRMIRGDAVATKDGSRSESEAGTIRPVPNPDSPSLRSVSASYAHPYYWSPFVIIGNGL